MSLIPLPVLKQGKIDWFFMLLLFSVYDGRVENKRDSLHYQQGWIYKVRSCAGFYPYLAFYDFARNIVLFHYCSDESRVFLKKCFFQKSWLWGANLYWHRSKV